MLEFEGIDDLIREVELLETVSARTRNRALKRAGDVLRERMKQEVYQHGLHEKSGEAQESIIRTDPKKGVVYVGTEGGVKQPGFYLYMHEFGYYNVRAGRFIPPKPFASVAFEMTKGEILDIYVEELRKEMGM
ncbi:HK97-gp10 family putative phage morphogenesis protein [Virgibacillus ndiopensis]|uniref:HK97-gp10 family putative phage morphogenesis protein n=1 Tax=Virgibacillus ndiopensis TaxID=2004408 RepID=UPI000C070A61|nr:HK97-gp10 family putative phage morphogenesis protein [Virgibacillus ndiopensis]